MKPSAKDQTEGSYYEIKGKIREIAGKISGDQELESESASKKIAGTVQKKKGEKEELKKEAGFPQSR